MTDPVHSDIPEQDELEGGGAIGDLMSKAKAKLQTFGKSLIKSPAAPPGDSAAPPGDSAAPPGDPAAPPSDPAATPVDPAAAAPPGDPAAPPGDPAVPPGAEEEKPKEGLFGKAKSKLRGLFDHKKDDANSDSDAGDAGDAGDAAEKKPEEEKGLFGKATSKLRGLFEHKEGKADAAGASGASEASPSSKTTDAMLDAMRAGALSHIFRPITTLELCAGVALLSCVFLYGWITGLKATLARCQGPAGCDAMAILTLMAGAMAKTWIILVVVLAALLAVEILVIGVVATPPGKLTGGRMSLQSLHILFTWLLEPRMILAVLTSAVLTFGATILYVTWIQLKRKSTSAEMRSAIFDVYVFQLVAFFAFVGIQVWLIEGWRT